MRQPESIHDGIRFERLVEGSSRKVEVKDVIGEAYDFRWNFNILDEKGIEPIIKVRENAVKRLRECPVRKGP